MRNAFTEILEDEYSEAFDAAQLGLLLTNTVDGHAHLQDAVIAYLFRDQELKRGGKVEWASCTLWPPGSGAMRTWGRLLEWAVKHITGLEPDFVILIDRNIWSGLDARQKLALVDHELCFPGDVEVTGPSVERSFVRRYSGELVRIGTASGHFVSGTPNHPILTDRGWTPLALLKEGDCIVRCGDPERVAIAMSPHEHQAPAAIEQVSGPHRVTLRPGVVPKAAENFDSEVVANGQIDVIAADRRLLLRANTTIFEPKSHHDFKVGNRIQVRMARLGHLLERSLRMMLAAPSGMRLALAGEQLGALIWAGESQLLGFGVVPLVDPGLLEDFSDPLRCDMEFLDQLTLRCPGNVALDKVVSAIKIPSYEGHVYNLQTSQGWYIANGVVAHNCHAGQQTDEEGCPKFHKDGSPMFAILQHDVEEFDAVIQRHGAWNDDLVSTARALIDALNHGPTVAIPSDVREQKAG